MAAFRARGLDVHGLRLDLRQPALLGAMDRLLSVFQAAPGGSRAFRLGRGWGHLALTAGLGSAAPGPLRGSKALFAFSCCHS